jgi:hypothetical protein
VPPHVSYTQRPLVRTLTAFTVQRLYAGQVPDRTRHTTSHRSRRIAHVTMHHTPDRTRHTTSHRSRRIAHITVHHTHHATFIVFRCRASARFTHTQCHRMFLTHSSHFRTPTAFAVQRPYAGQVPNRTRHTASHKSRRISHVTLHYTRHATCTAHTRSAPLEVFTCVMSAPLTYVQHGHVDSVCICH